MPLYNKKAREILSIKHTLSITITSFNYGQYLEQCIESALKHTTDQIEILVLDNASTDKTTEVLNKYQSNRNIFIIKNTENLGEFQNWINGINLATGDYICHLCADDYFTETFINESLNAIKQHSPDVIFSKVIYRNEQTKTLNKYPHPLYRDWDAAAPQPVSPTVDDVVEV